MYILSFNRQKHYLFNCAQVGLKSYKFSHKLPLRMLRHWLAQQFLVRQLEANLISD